MQYKNAQIGFYANYSNRTSGESINGSGIYCNISFSEDGISSMTFDSESKLYIHNRTFASAGVYYFNITCNDTNDNFASLNATDYASINEPDGPGAADNVTVLSSERGNITGEPVDIYAQGGNMTELTINASLLSRYWQGFYGTVGAEIYLRDGAGSTLYDWRAASPEGEVYATRAIDVNFAEINCSSAADITKEEAYLGQNSSDIESVRNTFSKDSHPAFNVGGVSIDADSCNATNLYVNSSSQDSDFYEVLLSDAASNMVYTALLDPDTIGFDNSSYDFEMLVGEKGDDDVVTEYYFYVEIG
jgi:hypothetical protein